VKKVLNAATNFANAYDNVLQTPHISIKKMYNILRDDFENVRWSKMICNNPTFSKCLSVNWLDIHARLPTCEGLDKDDIHCDLFCKKENESHSRLFFNCEYYDVVWTSILQLRKINISTT
jgi:hypothetical protein